MSIVPCSGNLLDDSAQVLVNPVNCVGVMGKGLALAFRQRFPMILLPYQAHCYVRKLRPGTIQFVPLPDGRLVANFPTKDHWRDPSQLGWIREGLSALVEELTARGISTVAVPPLGCGNGGLRWREVRALIVVGFAAAPWIEVRLYEPTVRR